MKRLKVQHDRLPRIPRHYCYRLFLHCGVVRVMTSQQRADILLAIHQSNRGRVMSENGEAFTPKEEAEIKVETTIRDAWLAVTEACNLHRDMTARPFIERQVDDIRSMKTKIDLLLSAILVSANKRSAA